DTNCQSAGCGFAFDWAETGATASPEMPPSEPTAARAHVSKTDLNMPISTDSPARKDDRLLVPARLRRRLLARLVDRDVVTMRQRRLAVGDYQRVELDEAVALLVVIADDFRAGRDHIAGLRGGKQLHAAADVNPGAEDGVVDQRLVHHPLQQAGMAETFFGVDRIGFPDIGEILLRRLARPVAAP